MIVAGNNQPKKSYLFSPKRDPAANLPHKKGEPVARTSRSRRGLCRSANDCMSMGSTLSTTQSQQRPKSLLEQQVEDLEKEVVKQKELRIMYRKRMERTHDYLKYCLQVAQDHGFLDLILHKNIKNDPNPQESPVVSSPFLTANASPQFYSPIPIDHKNSDLSALICQAKMNGWYIDHCEIEVQEKIGQGSTAEIYKAVWRGLDVAVKCINPDFFLSNESGVAFFAQELETLSKQRHRFVLQLMGACLDPPSHAWIVTEYLGLTLKEWLHGSNKGRRKERLSPLPPFKERIGRALEIAQAMQYLHEQKPKVIHRDLKPSNIFLDDAFHVRVADFGHARFLGDEEMALTGETGTYVYMAPEVIRCEPYNEKCDVYSFSIILNEIITGNHPYIETDFGPTKIGLEVAEGKLRPMLPAAEDQKGPLINLICASWDQDPSVRPSFGTITSVLKTIQLRIIDHSCSCLPN
ncbi:serine/threonine-protein kinase STY8-like [Mercurialis annua]|uniref:serine/threonine-protein kinase STY8-like n=1 Tax=Mercurialis annua TaxID=3986 RepID=UPI0024ACA9AF|nr:serine/threonine-protein kinase STY8-like [Mercurialis annua]